MPPANKIQNSGASVERAETKNEQKTRLRKVQVYKWQAKTAAACLLARALLLYYYTKCMMAAQQARSLPLLNSGNIVAFAFLLVETTFTLYRIFPQHLQSIQFGQKARFRPRLRILGDHVPTIDVLIFYCGEELDILLDTTRAACSSDYPQSKFKVVVLDDSASVSKHIEPLKAQFPNLFYSTRGPRESSWHKAGNINHGLSYVISLPGGPNEFVAGLDVDMLPETDWLRRLVPHFLRDPSMGLVSPNQRFYNVPSGDPLGQLLQFDQLLMVRQMRKDFGDTGLGGGSGWLARRLALDSIGGFATDSISEDFLTCVDLMKAGWSVAMLDENLQWGLAPTSFNGHTKQIQRWTMAMLSFHGALTGTARPRNLLAFKIFAEFSIAMYVVGMFLCYFGLPLMVMSGKPMVEYAGHHQLKRLLALSFLDFAAQSMHGFLESWVADFNIYCWHEPSHLWQALLYIGPAMRHWFPGLSKLVFGIPSMLQPANSVANQSSEDQHTAPWSRLKVLLAESYMAPHVFVLCSCIAGLITSLLNIWSQQHPDRREQFQHIITHIGWPPALFLWTSVLANALVPFYYALFVAPRAQREEYLERDSKSLVAYPTTQAKDQRHRRVREWHLCLVAIYYLLVVVGSWWL